MSTLLHSNVQSAMDIAFWVEPSMLAQETAFVRHLIMGLKSEGQQVTFLTPYDLDLAHLPVLGSRTAHYRWHRWERLPVLQKLRLNNLARELADNPPDALVVWGSAEPSILHTLAQMLPSLPIILWCWDASELFGPLSTLPTLRHVVVASDAIKTRVPTNFPHPVTVVHPGVYVEDTVACFDVDGQLPCLVSLDPLSDIAAYESLLRACRMIADKIAAPAEPRSEIADITPTNTPRADDFLLFAYDTGKEEYNIWQLAESLNLLDRLSFVPFQQDAEPLLLHGDIYIHVLPSSRVQYRTLEAMARGLAVVTCANHGADYLHDNSTARIVGPQTPEAWRDALLELINDRPRTIQLAKRGQNYIRDHHSMGRTLEQFGSICRQAAGLALPLR